MEIRLCLLLLQLIVCADGGLGAPIVYSAKLLHRFSDEAKLHRDSRVLKSGSAMGRSGGFWPQRRSLEYYRRLLSSDLQRQTLKLNPQFQFIYPSEGSATLPLGNDFGWFLLSFISPLFYEFVFNFSINLLLCFITSSSYFLIQVLGTFDVLGICSRT